MNRSQLRPSYLVPALVLMLVATGASPALQNKEKSSEERDYIGILLPKLCAARFPELLPHADEHSLTCAIFPQCYESGYGIVMSDKFYGFDEKGDDMEQSIKLLIP